MLIESWDEFAEVASKMFLADPKNVCLLTFDCFIVASHILKVFFYVIETFLSSNGAVEPPDFEFTDILFASLFCLTLFFARRVI